jgi:hypothetical protein
MNTFDWQYYLDKYPDLRLNGITTKQQSLQHWIEHGKKEGRISIRTPALFDWQYYLDKYPDLRLNGITTKQQSLEHWIEHGKKEGRNPIGQTCGFAISTFHRNDSRIESFKICISSIMKYKKKNTIVIIVDDGSTIKTHIKWVRSTFPTIIVVEKSSNSGISKTKNTCLRMLYEKQCDYFFLLDDDIEFLQPIEDKYIHSLCDENVNILSGRANSNPVESNYSKYTSQTNHLNGFLLCFSKHTFITAGYFKVFTGKYGHEHTWYTQRVMECTKQSGYFDISSNNLYVRLLLVESSVSAEQQKHEFAQNEQLLHTFNKHYEKCIE